MSGYVRIHRDLIGHASFRNDAEAMAFAWMIAKAAWRPVRVRYKQRAFNLERGQLSVSQRDMAAALDRDKAWVERLWKRLRDEAMIEVAFEAGAAVVTICNYDVYQGSPDTREAAGEAPREADVRQAQGTEQEDKELKNTSEPIGSSVVETREPKPFALPAGMGIDPQHWKDFLANRKRKRLPSTATAYDGQLRALASLADDAWPPGRLVQHAAEKGWGSINDPRSSGTQNGQRPANDRPDQLQNVRLRAAVELNAERDRGQRYGGF